MKKIKLSRLLWLVAAIPLFFACDDAPYYGEGIDSEFNKLYSNKSNKNHVTADLSLTYNGYEFLGREIYFNLMTKETAKIKFFSVFPGEAETLIENVKVSRATGGYTISGSYMTPAGTTFILDGDLKTAAGKPCMELTVSGLAIAPNILTQKGKFKTFETGDSQGTGSIYPDVIDKKYNFLWNWMVTIDGVDEPFLEFMDEMPLTDMVEGILSNLLYLAVDELEFHADGEITATYCRFEDFDITGILGGVTEADRGPKEVSPKGLISYYVSPDNMVRVRPNMEMIFDLVARNQGRTRAEGDSQGGLDILEILGLLGDVLNLYPEIQKVFTDGLGFVLKVNDPNEEIQSVTDPAVGNRYYGDYKLYMDTNLLGDKVLDSMTGLVTTLWKLLELDLAELIPQLGELGMDIGPIIDQVIERIGNTKEIQLGLYLEAAQ